MSKSELTANKARCEYGRALSRGLVIENPVLRLALGTCPTLAVSTSLRSALGMGVAATMVLICSNIVISSLRKWIPDKVRIPAFITIIASFVTIVQMLVKAYLPEIDTQLGVYLPLIVVNCIILGRAEAFASKNPVLLSAVDGLGMGIGFTAALSLMGILREFFGAGSFYGIHLWPESVPPIVIFILPPGGFFVFGVLVALANTLAARYGMAPMQLNCCAGCTLSPHCAVKQSREKSKEEPLRSEAETSGIGPADAGSAATGSNNAGIEPRPFADSRERLSRDEFKNAHLTELPEDAGPASSYDSVKEMQEYRRFSDPQEADISPVEAKRPSETSSNNSVKDEEESHV